MKVKTTRNRELWVSRDLKSPYVDFWMTKPIFDEQTMSYICGDDEDFTMIPVCQKVLRKYCKFELEEKKLKKVIVTIELCE